MAAVVKAHAYTGATPTSTSIDSADSGTVKFGRDDTPVSTTSVPIPTATGTKFSYVKWTGLEVMTTSTTNLSNLRVNMSAALASGLSWFWGSASAYTQQNGTQGTAAANYPTDAGTNAATPATITGISAWTAMTTSAVVYDSSTGLSTGTLGVKGKYCCLTAGVDFTYAAGGGAATMGNLVLTYDEQ